MSARSGRERWDCSLRRWAGGDGLDLQGGMGIGIGKGRRTFEKRGFGLWVNERGGGIGAGDAGLHLRQAAEFMKNKCAIHADTYRSHQKHLPSGGEKLSRLAEVKYMHLASS